MVSAQQIDAAIVLLEDAKRLAMGGDCGQEFDYLFSRPLTEKQIQARQYELVRRALAVIASEVGIESHGRL